MSLFDLWLPILLSAVFVFVASSVIHMALPIHKGDFQKLSNEADVLAGMREQGVSPGHYMFPCAGSMAEMATPEHLEKMNLGPVGWMTVVPNGPMQMGKALGQWFAFSVVIGVFVAYLAKFSLAPGAAGGEVFRVTAAIGILGYAMSNVTDSIWKAAPWAVTWRYVFDGLVYGLVTAAAFALMWPAVA